MMATVVAILLVLAAWAAMTCYAITTSAVQATPAQRAATPVVVTWNDFDATNGAKFDNSSGAVELLIWNNASGGTRTVTVKAFGTDDDGNLTFADLTFTVADNGFKACRPFSTSRYNTPAGSAYGVNNLVFGVDSNPGGNTVKWAAIKQ